MRGIQARRTGRWPCSAINPSPADIAIAISDGRSRHDGVNLGMRRRMSHGVQLSAWYSLSRSLSTTGNSGDELDIINIQNAADPFNDVQFGPSRRSDSRHRATISAIFNLPWGFQVSPIWRYRSGLPVNIVEGVDLNLDDVNDDIPARAYAFDGVGNAPKDIGECKTINCGRGASLSQVNLRVSKGLRCRAGMRIEAIAEVFNLFNAKNPSGFGPSTQFRDPRLLIGADGQATDESELPAADDLCRRLPGAGAARRSDRVPGGVLNAGEGDQEIRKVFNKKLLSPELLISRLILMISLRLLPHVAVDGRALTALTMGFVAQGVDAGGIDPAVVEIEERADGDREIQLLVRPAGGSHRIEIRGRDVRRVVIHRVDEAEERLVPVVERA